MKKYTFTAKKHLHEKPTQPKYIFTSTAKAIVIADSEAEAKKKAAEVFEKSYYGTGILLSEAAIAQVCELPIDWSYGYCDNRVTGAGIKDKIGDAQIR